MFNLMARVPEQQTVVQMEHERKAAELRVSLKRQIRKAFIDAGREAPSLVGWSFAELLDLDAMVRGA